MSTDLNRFQKEFKDKGYKQLSQGERLKNKTFCVTDGDITCKEGRTTTTYFFDEEGKHLDTMEHTTEEVKVDGE